MAQIDMSKLMTGTQNSTESEELKHDEQPKTQAESVGLINNETERHEDINEIKPQTQTTEEETQAGEKAVVCYIGNGIWKDSKGALWADTDKTANIVRERKYTVEEYNEREDLKFMVSYGVMRVTFV